MIKMSKNSDSGRDWASEFDRLRKEGKWDEYLVLLKELLEALRGNGRGDQYLALLDNALADAKECYASSEPSHWDSGSNICYTCLSFLDEIAGVSPQVPKSYWDRRKYWNEKGRKRKKALPDVERYKGPDFALTREGCKLKVKYAQTAIAIPELLIQDLSQPASDTRSEVVGEMRRLQCEMQSWRIGNKMYVQNLAVAAYSAWRRDFEESPFFLSIMRYSVLKSLMQLKWHHGLSLLGQWRVYHGSVHILSSVCLFLLWVTSGFGERVGRYLASVVTLVVAFGLLYSWIGQVRIGRTDGIVERLTDGIYFSIVTFTTLGFGDLYPWTVVCKVLAVTEVVIGYVMLAILIHLVTRKLEL